MMLMMFHLPQKQFQSTLSARRATSSSAAESTDNLFQSTLSARRATGKSVGIDKVPEISIHALREESDIQC